MVPLGLLPYGLAALVALGMCGFSYHKGAQSREAEIVELRTSIELARKAAESAEKKAKEAAENVRIVYRTKVETITQEREAQRELVEVIRRDANCDLPASFRVLHDAAAGSPADPSTARTVTAAEAAETVADNYRAARENEAKLAALQSYLSQIQDAKPVN